MMASPAAVGLGVFVVAMAIGDGPFIGHYYQTGKYVWRVYKEEERAFFLGVHDEWTGIEEFWT